MPVKTKKTTKTATSIAELEFANRFIFKKVEINGQPITEEQWATLMYEYGRRFASIFAMAFSGQYDYLVDFLTNSAPLPGCPGNTFWMWWQLKWRMGDYDYINNKVYQQPITYKEFKGAMLNCGLLEQELLNMLFPSK